MAARMAAWEATTGAICNSVRKATVSMAKMLVGSAIARVSTVPCRSIGSTSYVFAMDNGTSATTSASISSRESTIDGTPYCRDRKPASSSSKMKRSLRRVAQSSSGGFCSARALAS